MNRTPPLVRAFLRGCLAGVVVSIAFVGGTVAVAYHPITGLLIAALAAAIMAGWLRE